MQLERREREKERRVGVQVVQVQMTYIFHTCGGLRAQPRAADDGGRGERKCDSMTSGGRGLFSSSRARWSFLARGVSRYAYPCQIYRRSTPNEVTIVASEVCASTLIGISTGRAIALVARVISVEHQRIVIRRPRSRHLQQWVTDSRAPLYAPPPPVFSCPAVFVALLGSASTWSYRRASLGSDITESRNSTWFTTRRVVLRHLLHFFREIFRETVLCYASPDMQLAILAVIGDSRFPRFFWESICCEIKGTF